MSLMMLSQSSTFHPTHSPQGCGEESGIGQDPVSPSGGSPTQPLLEDIDKLLKKLLSALGEGDDASSPDPGGDAQGGLDPQMAEKLAFIAQMWQAMNQQQPGGGGDDDGGTPAIGGSGGGIPAAGDVPMGGGTPAPSAPEGAVPGGDAAPAVDGGSSATRPGPSTSGSGNAEWGGLDTQAQTQANTPEQSAQVAGQYRDNLKKDFGLTDAQAAGVVGNLWHESAGMNSGISQGGAIGPFGAHQDDNAHGIGIAQFGGARADGLLQYAASHKDEEGKPLDPTSQAANYGYLKQELSTQYHGAIDAVKQTSNVADATTAFCGTYEKPTDPQMQSRLAFAQQAMSTAA